MIESGATNEQTMKAIEFKLKSSDEYAKNWRAGQLSLLENVRTAISRFTELTPEATRRRFQLMELGLAQSLEASKELEPEPEPDPEPYPTYEEYDKKIGGSYDKISEDRKIAIFNKVVEANTQEWENMSEEERVEAGKEIERIIKKDIPRGGEYQPSPTYTSLLSKQGFKDPDYMGVETITDEDIQSKMESIMVKKGITTKKRRKMVDMEKIKKDAIKALVRERQKQSLKRAKSVEKAIRLERLNLIDIPLR